MFSSRVISASTSVLVPLIAGAETKTAYLVKIDFNQCVAMRDGVELSPTWDVGALVVP